MSSFLKSRRKKTARVFFIFALMALLCPFASTRARAADAKAPPDGAKTADAKTAETLVTNATAAELKSARATLSDLQKTLAARDGNALRLIGIDGATAHSAGFQPTLKLTHLAVATGGALARFEYSLSEKEAPQGARELWLSRQENGGFALTDHAVERARQRRAKNWWKAPTRTGRRWRSLPKKAPTRATTRARLTSSIWWRSGAADAGFRCASI